MKIIITTYDDNDKEVISRTYEYSDVTTQDAETVAENTFSIMEDTQKYIDREASEEMFEAIEHETTESLMDDDSE